MVDPVCEHLPWDSEFFELRIGRVVSQRLSIDLVSDINRWAIENRMDCLYLLARSDHRQTIKLAEENGFSLVDVRITLQRSLAGVGAERCPSISLIRPYEPGDLLALRRIARESHYDSRFYFDARFSAHRCDELFDRWIERSCEGWADRVFVGLQDGVVAGYVTCHHSGRAEGQIGLIAVAPQARGVGLGAKLVQAALQFLARQNLSTATVITQGRNLQSQCLYQRSEFTTRLVELWYHKWFK